MKNVALIVFFISFVNAYSQQKWVHNKYDNVFDGTYEKCMVVGVGKDKTPTFVIQKSSDGLAVYLSGAGYSGCSNKSVLVKFGKTSKTLFYNLGSDKEKESWFFNFDNNYNREELFDSMRNNKTIYIRLNSSCGKDDYTFTLNGFSEALDSMVPVSNFKFIYDYKNLDSMERITAYLLDEKLLKKENERKKYLDDNYEAIVNDISFDYNLNDYEIFFINSNSPIYNDSNIVFDYLYKFEIVVCEKLAKYKSEMVEINYFGNNQERKAKVHVSYLTNFDDYFLYQDESIEFDCDNVLKHGNSSEINTGESSFMRPTNNVFYRFINNMDTTFYLKIKSRGFTGVYGYGVTIYFSDKSKISFPYAEIESDYISKGVYNINLFFKLSKDQLNLFAQKKIEEMWIKSHRVYVSKNRSKVYQKKAYCILNY